MKELEEEEERILRLTIMILGTVSTILCFFVVLTYTVFKEKRQSNTSVIIFFQAIAAMFLDAAFMIPGYFGESLDPSEGFLCHFQAACFVFFGEAIQYCWFFVALNLLRRVILDRSEIRPLVPLLITIVGSSLATSIMFLTNSVANDGIWCFIDNTDYLILFTCFYGVMVILSLAGTPLWLAIMYRMWTFLAEERNLYETTTSRSLRSSSLSEDASKEQLDQERIPRVAYRQKVYLLVRQVFYVTGFLVIFYIMLGNRISISIGGNSFAGWLIHAICKPSHSFFAFPPPFSPIRFK